MFAWLSPSKPVVLENHQIHIWRASVNLPEEQLNRLHQFLSADECQRAERFVLPKDRNAFIAARGILRLILSHYLKRSPEELGFCYGSYGKPALDPQMNPERFCFNLSHSHHLALYAVVKEQEVGVDLEQVKPKLDYRAIAQRFFSPQESAALLALPAGDRLQAFFNCWTRKEAYVKAQGRGLALPLNQFTVSLAAGATALLSINGDCQAAADWTLQTLHPGPGYVAALAIAGRNWQINCWQWEPFQLDNPQSDRPD